MDEYHSPPRTLSCCQEMVVRPWVFPHHNSFLRYRTGTKKRGGYRNEDSLPCVLPAQKTTGTIATVKGTGSISWPDCPAGSQAPQTRGLFTSEELYYRYQGGFSLLTGAAKPHDRLSPISLLVFPTCGGFSGGFGGARNRRDLSAKDGLQGRYRPLGYRLILELLQNQRPHFLLTVRHLNVGCC